MRFVSATYSTRFTHLLLAISTFSVGTNSPSRMRCRGAEIAMAAPVATETEPPSPARGMQILRHKPFLPPDFDQQTLENLWRVWPAHLSQQAEQADAKSRRAMTFDRYGLQEPPDALPGHTGPPFGYVDNGAGGLAMNCFACHGGQVGGNTWPGAPNTDLDLQTLVEETRLYKISRFERLGHLDLASLKIPLSGTRGTTNAVAFGVVLVGLREPDMTVNLQRNPGPLLHPDMDAPPWWVFRKKSRLYIDGFSPKNHRVLMQFMLLPENDRDTVYGWEQDFRHILAYLNSLEPPRYAGQIDPALAQAGQRVFDAHCAQCHGTYGPQPSYTERLVPIDEIGTDRLRLDSISAAHRQHVRSTWMTNFGKDSTDLDPGGYVAPPLDGIWASAPYLHNGSVPTLWHLLHPAERPNIWRRISASDRYDHERLGFLIETFPALPTGLADPAERRRFFDTRQPGKSAAGHAYPNSLTEPNRRAVLEYLKTL